MEFMDVIRKRRSIRKYQDQPLPQGALDLLLEAVMWSPSWHNTQVWEVVVVSEQAGKEKLAETLAPGNPATKAMVAAPVVLVVCGRLNESGMIKGQTSTKFGDWFMFDLGMACQNICLTAADQGLGTVVVGLFNHDQAAQVVNLPANQEVVAMIPVGVPAKTPSAPKRREPGEFTHYEKF
jgi:nitroreductase